jgi:hypothetical protein
MLKRSGAPSAGDLSLEPATATGWRVLNRGGGAIADGDQPAYATVRAFVPSSGLAQFHQASSLI